MILGIGTEAGVFLYAGLSGMTVMFAYGILSCCERISYAEFLQYASDVKLGVALGFLETAAFSALDDFIAAMRPANIGLYSDESLTPSERDVYRARRCRAEMALVRRDTE